MAEKETEARKKFADYVVEEARNGNVVFASLDDYGVAPLDEFIKQPADGILYDLNRLPEVVLTFIDDRKWVNDYAVYQVIKRLRELVPEWQPIKTAPKDGKWLLLCNLDGLRTAGLWGRPDDESPAGWIRHGIDGRWVLFDASLWMSLPDPPEVKD